MDDTKHANDHRLTSALDDATFPLSADRSAARSPTRNRDRSSRRAPKPAARTTASPAQKPPARRASATPTTAATTRPLPALAPAWTIPAGAQNTELLLEMIGAFVPVHILEMRSVPHASLREMAAEAAEIIASHGDDLIPGGAHQAATYTALSNGLAAAALLTPGGVDFMGLHFCAHPHDPCPTVTEAARIADGEDEQPPAEKARRRR